MNKLKKMYTLVTTWSISQLIQCTTTKLDKVQRDFFFFIVEENQFFSDFFFFYQEFFLSDIFLYNVTLYCYIRNRVILSYRNFVLFFSYAWENSNNCSSHFDYIFYFRSSRICSYVFPKRFSTLAGTKGREIYIILEINIFL